MRILAFSICVLGVPAGCAAPAVLAGAAPPVTQTVAPAQALPTNLRGITYDNISSACSVSQTALATETLLARPTVRVVFDPIGPQCYRAAVNRIHARGYVMGELIDSSAMKRYSSQLVRARVRDYLAALGSSVDVWEIGNEVNGEWLSNVKCPSSAECPAQAADVMAKVGAMYDAVVAAGGVPELTLYYQPPKTATPGYDMLAWERRYVPASMHAGLRYVLVSYYEGDNAGVRPSQAQWDAIFRQLARDFPNARVGFGEIGMAKPITAATLARATDVFTHYQTLAFADVPRYTRAGFWWNGAEDLVPSRKWPSFFRTVSARL